MSIDENSSLQHRYADAGFLPADADPGASAVRNATTSLFPGSNPMFGRAQQAIDIVDVLVLLELLDDGLFLPAHPELEVGVQIEHAGALLAETQIDV